MVRDGVDQVWEANGLYRRAQGALKPATISSPEFVGVECSCPEMGWEVVLIKLLFNFIVIFWL